MEGKSYHTVILGAGLSGLSAAYHSGYPVFEKRCAPGGTAGSVRKEGYVFDFGIHVIHSRNPDFHTLMQEIGAEFIAHIRRGLIYSYGAYAAYPFQVNTSHLSLKLRLQCVLGYLFRKRHASIHSYEDWIIQNFGAGFAEYFLIPYSKKFWGISPREMTHEWTGQQRVPKPRTMDVIKGAFRDQNSGFGPNAEFSYPSRQGEGFAGIAEAFSSKIDDIHYNMKATAIDPRNKVIIFNGGDLIIRYDKIISSLPLPELIGILSDPPLQVKRAIDRLRFNSIAIVNLGLNRSIIDPNHWIHYPDPDIRFFRISFPSNFCDGLNPKGTSTIQAEVSYETTTPPDKEELTHQIHRDLIKVGILKSSDHAVFKDVLFLKYGYVLYDHHRMEAVHTIHRYLNALDIFPCGRYGAWEYQWTDEAILSGRDMALQLLQRGDVDTVQL